MFSRERENLTQIPKQQLREVGWSKAVELVKVARRDGEDFDRATWLHKASEMPKEGFKVEVERHPRRPDRCGPVGRADARYRRELWESPLELAAVVGLPDQIAARSRSNRGAARYGR
jgi:hypothetical protein